MLDARSTRFVVIALAALALLLVLFYPTDEKRVERAATALLDAANAGPAALARALDEHASTNLRIDSPELGEPIVGRDAVLEAVARARSLGPNLRFRAEGVEISVEGSRARLTADLITTLRAEVPELRRPRHAAALFEQREGQFRLVSAEIGTPRLDQPEARP